MPGREPFKLKLLGRYVDTHRAVVALINDRIVENGIALAFFGMARISACSASGLPAAGSLEGSSPWKWKRIITGCSNRISA